MSSVGAGRTDAGVHALGQVMNAADLPEGRDLTQVRRALNAMCGPAIAVTRCSEVARDFHARFSARSRTYVYAVLEGEIPDPFLARTTWHHAGALGIDAMNEGAGHLLGRQDFSSFGRVEPGSNAERILFELSCRRTGRLVRIRARANAFIQQMVRSLVGTLVAVGEGKIDAATMQGILAAQDRAAAGRLAPARGLTLERVAYGHRKGHN